MDGLRKINAFLGCGHLSQCAGNSVAVISGSTENAYNHRHFQSSQLRCLLQSAMTRGDSVIDIGRREFRKRIYLESWHTAGDLKVVVPCGLSAEKLEKNVCSYVDKSWYLILSMWRCSRLYNWSYIFWYVSFSPHDGGTHSTGLYLSIIYLLSLCHL